MVQIRLNAPCPREFQKDVYRPGVISLSRLAWGSLGGGLSLALIALLSGLCGVGVLFPPLAATCFISAACAYLRVARPRQVIVGHLVSSAAGLLAVAAGNALTHALAEGLASPGPADWAVPLKLGLAVGLAAIFMQLCDADHPPAAATAAIPVLLPLPCAPLMLPLHMAWGSVLAVAFALAWNRVWFEFPAPEAEAGPTCLGLHQGRLETAGLGLCLLATVLMGLKPLSQVLYQGGLWLMLPGGLILAAHPLAEALLPDPGRPGRG